MLESSVIHIAIGGPPREIEKKVRSAELGSFGGGLFGPLTSSWLKYIVITR
jgi:hypothetical protein